MVATTTSPELSRLPNIIRHRRSRTPDLITRVSARLPTIDIRYGYAASVAILIAIFSAQVARPLPPPPPASASDRPTPWQTASVADLHPVTVTVPNFAPAITTPHVIPPEEDRALMTAIRAFHSGTEKLRHDADYLDSLAGLVGVAHFTDATAAKGALTTAKAQAQKMRPYAGRFPLPATTPDSLLTLLSPVDVVFLSESLKAMLVEDSNVHTLSSTLSKEGAVVTGGTQAYWQMGNTPGRCLTYDLTFNRAAYAATISGDACRTPHGWVMKTNPKH
ncbi:hypothetical protein [Hyphomicrobium sp. DY-1]|uniref:hypothetical protein n=1 Tax=Hyphomicrobium sp. DY-1 TaxID=3075650 RepID=UPI0039C0D26E